MHTVRRRELVHVRQVLAQQGMDFTARKVIEFNVHADEPVWICCLTSQVVVGDLQPCDDVAVRRGD
jgi:hypothetical protein